MKLRCLLLFSLVFFPIHICLKAYQSQQETTGNCHHVAFIIPMYEKRNRILLDFCHVCNRKICEISFPDSYKFRRYPTPNLRPADNTPTPSKNTQMQKSFLHGFESRFCSFKTNYIPHPTPLWPKINLGWMIGLKSCGNNLIFDYGVLLPMIIFSARKEKSMFCRNTWKITRRENFVNLRKTCTFTRKRMKLSWGTKWTMWIWGQFKLISRTHLVPFISRDGRNIDRNISFCQPSPRKWKAQRHSIQ